MNSGTGSRTRPGGRPDPTIQLLRELRAASRTYVLVLDAGLVILTDQFIVGRPELGDLRTTLRVATGRRGAGGIGTPIGIEHMVGRLLGES